MPMAIVPVNQPQVKTDFSNQALLWIRRPMRNTYRKVQTRPTASRISSGTMYCATTFSLMEATPKATR